LRFFGHQTVVRDYFAMARIAKRNADLELARDVGRSGFTTITELLKDARSEKAIHGSANTDESEQVHTGACKSAGTKK